MQPRRIVARLADPQVRIFAVAERRERDATLRQILPHPRPIDIDRGEATGGYVFEHRALLGRNAVKITQPFEGEGGSGTYQWIFNLWSQGDYTYTPGHPLAYDDELSPGGQIVCADSEGVIGPPLSSIALDVENGEWFDYPAS